MDHRRVVALLVLSATAAVLGHTHEEAVVDLSDQAALGGPAVGKVAQMGESNGARVGGKAVAMKPKKVGKLEAAHVQYMKLLDESRRVYCKETGGVFCQLMKGLRRQYFGALRSGSKKDYQNYLLRLNVRYCTGPKKNLQSRRCKLIPTFLLKLPEVSGLPDTVGDYIVSPSKQDAYIEKKGNYALKLSEMAEKYCTGKNHKVFCKQLTGLVASYKAAASTEKLAPRNAYVASFNTIRKQYCERKIDELTSRCKSFKLLSKIPATRLLAHPNVRITLDESKLSDAQQKYNKHLKDMQLQECGEDSHPTYCEMVVGMRQSFAAAITQNDENLHAAFLAKASKDLCDVSPDSKRCATLKLTAGNYAKLEGMPKKSSTPNNSTSSQNSTAAVKNTTTAAAAKNVTAAAKNVTAAAKNVTAAAKNVTAAAKNVTATAKNATAAPAVKNATAPAAMNATNSTAKNTTEEEMRGTEIAESNTKATEADDELKKTLKKAMTKAGYTPPKKRTKPGTLPARPLSEKRPVTTTHYNFGNGHLQNLTPEQEAYRASLVDVTKHYCGGGAKTKDFCGDASTLKNLFIEALKTQSNTKFKRNLTDLRFKKCKKPQQAATKKCKVLEVFAKTIPSVAHSGIDARKKLHQLQQSYLVSTRNAATRYCAVDENSLVCQVTRGLEREYTASLEHKTNIGYEHYLTNMEAQFCSTPVLTKKNGGRCALFMNLRKTMPISMTTLKTLPQMHSQYIQTLDSVQQNFCRGETDSSLACELARGIKRVFIHSLNAESNHDFDFYLTRIQDSFCVLATAEFTRICATIPTLLKGVPPAFNAEGFHRAIDSTEATKKISIAQGALGKRLDQDRQQYLATVKDVKKHYCGAGKDLVHPTYFCSLVNGLVGNYKYSLTSGDNTQITTFLEHLKRDFCIRGAADGYDKRCKFLPMLEHGLPLSKGEEKKLFHAQGEYLKATQDIVGHFCYKMTRSVFCQLSHGLVTQFIGAVTEQSNAALRTYMDNMQAHYCDAVTDKNTKQCQIFPVLRKGMPGVGLGAREAVTTASNVLTAAKSALIKARKARMLAQTGVKKNPSKQSLANLEVATHNELAAEKAVRDGQVAEVRKMAEAAGAPSSAAISVAVKQAKDLEGLSVKAKQNAVQVKYKTTQQITQAKALVLQTTMTVASATEDVKKTTSAENVKAVEKAMTASQDAKVALNEAEKQARQQIAASDDEATSVADRAANAREKVIAMKAAQQKAFAQLAFQRAQRSEDSAEEASVFARANAKQAAQKLFWARVYAKENPTAANEERVQKAAEEATQEAAVVKAAAGKALGAEEKTKLKGSDLAKVDNAVEKAAAGSTAVAHSKVKAAKLEAARAEREAGKQAALVKGTVSKKEITVAKAKEEQLCGEATKVKGAAVKSKVALEEATAAVKKSANDDTLNALKAVHKKYAAATKASAKAAAACNAAKSLADKLEGNADTSGKSEDQAKTAQLVAATDRANAAQAAVQAAEKEESKATKEKLFELKHDASVAADNAQLAAEKVAASAKKVKQQTELVAHKPSEANIGNLKKALEDRRLTERSKKLADDAVTEANAVEQRALMKAAEKTKSPTRKAELQSQLADKETSSIKTAKEKLEAAMKAASEATNIAAKDGSEKNQASARKAAEKVKSLQDKLAAVTATANQKKASSSKQRKSVEEVQQALTAALKKKQDAQDLAMRTPTNENLNAFRAEIRTVHSLQTELMIATQQKAVMSAPAKRKASPGDEKISQLIAGYCQDPAKEEMCKFYTPMEKGGWADEEARMGKQLLEEVASAAQLVEDTQMQVKADRATQASNPTAANKDKVSAAEKQLVAVRSSHLKTEARAAKFAQQTNHMNEITAGKTKKPQFKFQVSKLIDYYCKSNKHEKLCAYFTKMKAKSDAAAQTLDKTAFMNNSTDSNGKALSQQSIEKAKEAVAANATNATDVTMMSASDFDTSVLGEGAGTDVTGLVLQL